MHMEPWMYWVGGLILLIVILYNRLIYLRNKVNETFKSIDVYLEQRFDMLTKLAQAVASYTDYEGDIMEKITKLRTGFDNPDLSNNEKVKKSNEAGQMVEGLRAQFERYPDLLASNNYLQLQRSINEVEEKLSASRRAYNARVNQYNTWTQSFPIILFARILGFPKREMLQVAEYKKQDVDMRSILRS